MRSCSKLAALSLVVSANPLLTSAVAAAGPARQDPCPWTVDDIVRAERASQWTLSRDGRLAAWVLSTVEEVEGEEKRVSNVWLTRVSEAVSVPLTRGTETVDSLVFSPSGRLVAFLSTRPLPKQGDDSTEDEVGKRQAWIIPVDGGEAYPRTRFERDILDVDWIDSMGRSRPTAAGQW